MILISHIVNSLANPYVVWRTLRGVEIICRDGRPIYSAGNVSAVFQIWHEGQKKCLKCYIRSNPNLKHIYRSQFYERELCVFELSGTRHWIDCLLVPYTEGITLEEAICKAKSREEFGRLAKEFDRMARWLLEKPFAHGDLKPENIIVRSDGKMRVIDWDSAFLPQFAGSKSFEQGTAAYQHPKRDGELFDKHIDDYSIAMISTLLHAYSAEPELCEQFRQEHEHPITPTSILSGTDRYFEAILELFARRAMAREYHIAKLLTSPIAQLFDLKRLLSLSTAECHGGEELEESAGLWGYRNREGWTVSPLYEMGFEPMDGVGLVRLGGYNHFITTDGRLLGTFDRGVRVKPLKGRQAQIINSDGTEQIINLEELVKCE